jgi:hypothetical protein
MSWRPSARRPLTTSTTLEKYLEHQGHELHGGAGMEPEAVHEGEFALLHVLGRAFRASFLPRPRNLTN